MATICSWLQTATKMGSTDKQIVGKDRRELIGWKASKNSAHQKNVKSHLNQAEI